MSVAQHITTAVFRTGITFATLSTCAAAQLKLMYCRSNIRQWSQGYSLTCTHGQAPVLPRRDGNAGLSRRRTCSPQRSLPQPWRSSDHTGQPCTAKCTAGQKNGRAKPREYEIRKNENIRTGDRKETSVTIRTTSRTPAAFSAGELSQNAGGPLLSSEGSIQYRGQEVGTGVDRRG
jgi:hypothetical protein